MRMVRCGGRRVVVNRGDGAALQNRATQLICMNVIGIVSAVVRS